MQTNHVMGDYVALEPLTAAHKPALLLNARERKHPLWHTGLPSVSEFDAWFEQALLSDNANSSQHFAVRLRHASTNSDQIIAWVAINRWSQTNLRARLQLEDLPLAALPDVDDPIPSEPELGEPKLGDTELSKQVALLLMDYAVSDKRAIVVEFATFWHHQALRALAVSLGAQQDGVLRNHRILADGTVHDQVIYSVLDSEWRQMQARRSHT